MVDLYNEIAYLACVLHKLYAILSPYLVVTALMLLVGLVGVHS